MNTTDPKIRRLLEDWKNGDSQAFDHLIPLIYEELRDLAKRCCAGERRDHTLQPTALVAEVYVELEGVRSLECENKDQLLLYLTRVMRRVLIDHARGRGAEKRWGRLSRRPLEEAFDQPLSWHPEDAIAFDQALERLSQLDPRQARIVELRLVGLGLVEMAEILECSKSTVHRELQTAKLWLRAALHEA